MEGLRRRRAVYELAVYAVSEARSLLHGLEVNIGRLCLESLDHDRVDHADDRRVSSRVERRVKGIGAFFFAAAHLDVALVALHDVFHREGGVRGVCLALEALQRIAELGSGRDQSPYLAARPARHLFLCRKVERIGEGYGKAPVHFHQRKCLCAIPSLDFHPAEKFLRRDEARWD